MVGKVSILVCALLMLRFAAPAAGQVVRGVVLDETAGAPIKGAMVVLLDAAGHVAARSITDSDGSFVAWVQLPGQYRARIDRIGYHSVTTDGFDAPPEGAFQRIVMPIRPVQLAGLNVSAGKRCEVRPEVGRATAAVWEEARKALEAATWTAESAQYSYTFLHFVRRIDLQGETTLREDREFFSLRGRAPYVSIPAEQLAEQGYLREVSGGNLSYYAPDAEVLLSDPFLDTHCMRLQQGTDGLVGLAFEPVEGRKLPEVKGILWLDAATADLRHMEYRYVNISRRRATGDAGGEMSFERLEAGTWIVRKWHVRMPLMSRLIGRGGRAGYRRAGYEEKGGVVWRAADGTGAVVYEATTGVVSGQVLDSVGAPMAGVAILPRGIENRALSDSTGSYVLAGLPEGRIELEVGVPLLDTLGLSALNSTLTVNLTEGGTARLDVRIPAVRDIVSQACGGKNRPAETAILLGRVMDSGVPAGGATVRVTVTLGSRRFELDDRAAPRRGTGGEPRWHLIEDDDSRLETTLDDRGIFLLCDVPIPSVVQARAEVGERTSESRVIFRPDAFVTVVTLTLPPATN